MEKLKIGILGCGNISSIYFTNLTSVFKNIEVYACGDLIEERRKRNSEKFGVERIMTLEEMCACPEIRLILNITQPANHYYTTKEALAAGKSVYVEKPLSLTTQQGAELVELAKKNGVFLGGAPDTFLGAGIQTCRKLIDDGFIGEPIGATAFMVCPGHESWHPDPEFYYQFGGGPMLDMGPYYITALVNLMGSVDSVCGMSRITFPQRTITSEPKFGQKIDVEVPTHIGGTMRFRSGAIGTVLMSFDVKGSTLPRIEIYGTHGSMVVPDPNCFGGPVLIKTENSKEFFEIPLTHAYDENSRGLGLSDMAECLLHGGEPRASCALTNHVLEIMTAFDKSSESESFIKIATCCERPAPMEMHLIKGYVREK